MPIYQTSAPVSPIEAYMYIDPLSGSTMFREFIGTVPQGQSVLRLSERVRTFSDKRERERRSRDASEEKSNRN